MSLLNDFKHPEFSYKTSQQDVTNLYTSLTECFALARIEYSEKKPIRILSIACGRSDETGILLHFFAPQATHCTFYGVDIRAREIGEANTRWRKFTHESARFLVHDATKLDQIVHLTEPFDYVFIRHQNFWNGDSIWYKIYAQALKRLRPNGHLIITSYFDREHMEALHAIQAIGGRLVLSHKNTRSRILEEKIAKSADRHIAIFKKGQDDDTVLHALS